MNTQHFLCYSELGAEKKPNKSIDSWSKAKRDTINHKLCLLVYCSLLALAVSFVQGSMGKNCPETPLGCDWWPGYLQLPLPGEQLLVSLLELILPLLGVQVLDQLGLGGHGRRTLARPPHQAARPLELQHKIFLGC